MVGITASPQAGAHSNQQLLALTSVRRLRKTETTADAPCTITDSLLESGTQQNEISCKYPQPLCHKRQTRQRFSVLDDILR